MAEWFKDPGKRNYAKWGKEIGLTRAGVSAAFNQRIFPVMAQLAYQAGIIHDNEQSPMIQALKTKQAKLRVKMTRAERKYYFGPDDEEATPDPWAGVEEAPNPSPKRSELRDAALVPTAGYTLRYFRGALGSVFTDNLAVKIEREVKTMGAETFAAMLWKIAENQERTETREYLKFLARAVKNLQGEGAIAFDLGSEDKIVLEQAIETLAGGEEKLHVVVSRELAGIRIPKRVNKIVVAKVNGIKKLLGLDQEVLGNVTQEAKTNPYLLSLISEGKIEGLDASEAQLLDIVTRSVIGLILGKKLKGIKALTLPHEKEEIRGELLKELFAGVKLDERTKQALIIQDQTIRINVGLLYHLFLEHQAELSMARSA